MNYEALAEAIVKAILASADELARTITKAVIEEKRKPRPIPKLPPDPEPVSKA